MIVVAAAAAGFFAHRYTRPAPGTLYPMPVRSSEALDEAAGISPEHSSIASNTRKIPDDLPDISLPDLDGKLHSLTDYRGKLLLVNFWATWCEPCRREIPLLKSLHGEYAKDGVEIVGIAVDSPGAVAKYVSEQRMTYPILLGERGGFEAARALGMDLVLPFSVFADRAGHIVALKIGELRPDEARMILSVMGDLDRGRLTLKAAQTRIAGGLAALPLPIPSASGSEKN